MAYPGAGSPSITGCTGTTLVPDGSKRDADGARRDLFDRDAERRADLGRRDAGTACARARTNSRSSTATTSPSARWLNALDAPRTRTSTCAGGLSTTTRSAGMFWSSSGTRRVRSTTGSPATVSQSSTAIPTDSDLQAEMANGW